MEKNIKKDPELDEKINIRDHELLKRSISITAVDNGPLYFEP